jgi:SAM-dependent methyltransferase
MMTGDPRTWFDATAERMLASRAAISDLEVVGDLDAFQRDKRRRVLDWLASRPLQGKRVLEVGCGAGGNLRFLRRHGAEVEGADISPRMVEVATKLNRARGVEFPITVIDGALLPHPDATFDVVLTVTALQHNHDGPALESLVGEIARVLRPDGEAWILEGVHKVRSVHRQSVHRHREEYAAMFTGAGLVARSYASLPSHYPHWMARWQQVSTASRRAFLKLGRRDLQNEADFLRRFGDGARLDSLASRGIYVLSRLVDPVVPGPDALGLFVFGKPA